VLRGEKKLKGTAMKVRTLTLLFVVLSATNVYCDEPVVKPPKTVTITISPETTYITEPLLPDGRVDYYGAINRRLSQGVTPENNIAAGIFSLIPGERESPLLLYKDEIPSTALDEVNNYRQRYWQHLGFDSPPGIESLQFLSPRVNEGEELEYLLKFFTPEEIIGRLYDHQKPKDNDVNPLEFLQDAQKNDEWMLRQAINLDWYDATSRLWTEKDYPLLADWFPTMNDMERQLIEVSKRPKFYNAIIGSLSDEETFLYSTLLPYVQASREVARFMAIRGNWYFTHGEYDKAFECAFASLRVGRALRSNNAFVVEDLVGVAICGIANHQILTYLTALEGKKDTDWLMAKRAEYAVHWNAYSVPAVPQWITWERCGMLAAIMSLNEMSDEFTQMIKDADDTQSKELTVFTQRFIQVLTDENTEFDFDKVLRLANGYFDELEDMLYLPGYQRRNRAYNRIENRITALRKELETRSPDSDVEQFIADCMYCNFSPALRAAIWATTRPEYEAKVVDVTFALTAWRMEHGDYPETLEQLVPQYLAEMPVSPYSEKPIRYFKRDNMLLLSSSDDYQLGGSDEALEKKIAYMCEKEPYLRAGLVIMHQESGYHGAIFIVRY
jgi:hypothetical protein